MISHYSEEEVRERLTFFPGWEFQANGIHKNYEFRDFVDAFSFMTRVAMESEKLNHHPEWSNVYNKVKVRLSTHEAGGLTDLDFKLAEIIDKRCLSK